MWSCFSFYGCSILLLIAVKNLVKRTVYLLNGIGIFALQSTKTCSAIRKFISRNEDKKKCWMGMRLWFLLRTRLKYFHLNVCVCVFDVELSLWKELHKRKALKVKLFFISLSHTNKNRTNKDSNKETIR